MQSVEVRSHLVDALRLDLVGPDAASGLGAPDEVLPQSPSRWYLTGFLVPSGAAESQKTDGQSNDDLDQGGESGGADDDSAPEPAAARLSFLPSSLGISLLVLRECRRLAVTVRWGDYQPRRDGRKIIEWQRTDRAEEIAYDLSSEVRPPDQVPVPESGGLFVSFSVRPVPDHATGHGLPAGLRAVSVFLVNRREPDDDEVRDQAFAFQAQLQVGADQPFVGRPVMQSPDNADWDERLADLTYRESLEYAVGHGVAAQAHLSGNGECVRVSTCWIPQAEVERVAPATIEGVELGMDALARLADGAEARAQMGAIVDLYRAWIAGQEPLLKPLSSRRKEMGDELLARARVAADRIERGISLLDDAQCRRAFCLANAAMAAAARRRQGVMAGKDPATVNPRWRPFQLAFILMNLPGIADPASDDRRTVDLLFFPTGGGKTEAYLGLAAFTLVLRRLRHPGIGSAGLSVLMRYTLRLLTLDQLGRAATLICALELERQNDVATLGEWPFEIALWVGRAATPNSMGRKGDNKTDTARARTIAFQNNSSKPSPIPLEECPWCGERLIANSFRLMPNPDQPTDLRVTCVNRGCAFTRDNPLPILTVDEPIYRRLPCFMIATVDKFAALPWTGEVGAFFGRVQRFDHSGFYGPCQPGRGSLLPSSELPPPDLIIQDELHLISGPLGTMVGLYESAIDELASRTNGGIRQGPKIIASTATVRRAQNQIRALFNRKVVDVFPPPGPNPRDSFFARTHAPEESHARLYVGIAAQGRSPKIILLRTYLALLAAAQLAYESAKPRNVPDNPADPYMTLVGYFNSLRELGGARRIIEDEVRARLLDYSRHRRVGEPVGSFADRTIAYEPVELTSRVPTAKIAEAKQLLSQAFSDKKHVDVAIATNMISVGLDITRLGLMVVFGQPKTSAEYIQATSRVGRDIKKPGLVVSILNIHKPRDRSHYERFEHYHNTFYRSVEATSVTPFSPRALDRGLAGSLVGMTRQGHLPMTPPLGASEILQERPNLSVYAEAVALRAQTHAADMPHEEAAALADHVRAQANDLLDEWSKYANELRDTGTALQYQAEAGSAQRLIYEFLDPALKSQPLQRRKFRANRSLRDVEPSVNLWLKTFDNVAVEEEEES